MARNNEPYTPMKPIVEGMGLDWKSQFTKLKQRFASTVVEITIVANDGKERLMTCLPLRKLFGWLATISPNKVKPEIRDTVIKYQEECDDALYAYWTKGVAVKPTFDLAETLSQTLNQISNGNRKLYMSMYNGLNRRFGVGRLAEIPHTEIHNALATIYFFAVEWHRKNTPTQLPLKLNDGEHYLVVKDGVVLWERKLKSNCNDIPANTLQNPTLMLEHICEVVGEFVGKQALLEHKPLENENNLVMISRDTTNKVMDYFAALRHEINRLGGKLPIAPNFDKETIIRAVVTDMMDSSRMLVSFDFMTGKPQITFVPNDCFVATRDNLAQVIAGGDGVPRKYLPDIIKAAVNRLSGN